MVDTSYFQRHYSPGFFYGSKRKKLLKHIHEEADENRYFFEEGIRILDVGFHHGLELTQIMAFHPQAQIVGMEIFDKKKMKALSREFKDLAHVSILSGDLNHLDFEENYFDVIYLLDVLYLAESLSDACRQLITILKRKGKLIISLDITDTLTSSNESKYQKAKIAYLKINLDELARCLKRHGIKRMHPFESKTGHLVFIAEKK